MPQPVCSLLILIFLFYIMPTREFIFLNNNDIVYSTKEGLYYNFISEQFHPLVPSCSSCSSTLFQGVDEYPFLLLDSQEWGAGQFEHQKRGYWALERVWRGVFHFGVCPEWGLLKQYHKHWQHNIIRIIPWYCCLGSWCHADFSGGFGRSFWKRTKHSTPQKCIPSFFLIFSTSFPWYLPIWTILRLCPPLLLLWLPPA